MEKYAKYDKMSLKQIGKYSKNPCTIYLLSKLPNIIRIPAQYIF